MATRQEREAREARERLQVYSARQQVHARRDRRRRFDNVLAVLGLVVIVGIAITANAFYFSTGPGAPKPAASESATPTDEPAAGTNVGDVPDPALAEARTWTGTLTINDIPLAYSLDGAAAPQAVAAFVQEVQQNYFPGKTCHRLVNSPGFGVLQCGSVDGAGGNDPTFSFGPIENAPADNVYPAGTIAMARASDDAYSNGRQFFITTTDTTIPSDTAGGYTVLGTVTGGLDQLISGVVDGGVSEADGDGPPNVPTSITAVTIQ